MKKKSFLLATGLSSVLLVSGCSHQEKADPLALKPVVKKNSMPSLASLTDPLEAAPPPIAAEVTPATEPAADVETGPSKATDLERLNWALGVYFDNPEKPAIHSFEPLIAAGLIKKVPDAPPGKEYVIDMSHLQVKLVQR